MRLSKQRPIEEPIIFNARAVKPELKEEFQDYEFWTCTLEEVPSYNGLAASLRRGNVWSTQASVQESQVRVIDFKEEVKKEDSPLTRMPLASLTVVLGLRDFEGDFPVVKKLCEITSGDINPETYKALQAFMFDIQLNPNGIHEGWFNQREDKKWQLLRA